jgi:hypothetical protein
VRTCFVAGNPHVHYRASVAFIVAESVTRVATGNIADVTLSQS